eukprot:TRINITY_DN1806_c0_g1_i7.p1 TRINITY_DN1806_c0_g1~~TRINITY_DN1806_c0_g1_i7.p1  ORF type:complete len:1928 (+),score=397.07 TRINITY_DN1806_c0_g1_i7:814-5784(+)
MTYSKLNALYFSASFNPNPEISDTLIKSGLKVNATVLFYCVMTNPNPSVCEFLIKSGAPVNQADEKGMAALHYAAIGSYDPKMCAVLIANGASIDMQDKRGNTPLHYACLFKRPWNISLLLKHGARPDIRNKEGFLFGSTALDLAKSRKFMESVEPFLQHSAGVQLLESAEHGSLSGVRAALASCQSLNLDFEDRGGQTALMIAARCGHLELLEFCASMSADLNRTDQSGNSALHHSAASNQLESCKILISKGANICARNELGKSPAELAQRKGPAVLAYLGPLELFALSKRGESQRISELIDQKVASVSDVDSNGDTALHHAASNGHLALCQSLVTNHGANMQPKNNDGLTPAQLAAKAGHSRVVEFFPEASPFLSAAASGDLEKVATLLAAEKTWDINSTGGSDQQTALMSAAKYGHLNVVLFLLSKSASTLLRDKSGKTALDLAAESRQPRVVVALLLAESDSPVTEAVHAALAAHYSCAEHRSSLLQYLRSPFFSFLLRIERSEASLTTVEINGGLDGRPVSPEETVKQICYALVQNTNPRLQSIKLTGLGLEHAGEVTLASCLALKTGITHIDVSDTKITGGALLLALPLNLKHLSLNGCTNVTLLPASVARLTRLEKIDLHGTGIRIIPLELHSLPLQQLKLPESCAVDAGGNIPREFLVSNALDYLRGFGAFLVSCRTASSVALKPGTVGFMPSSPEELCDVLVPELSKNTSLKSLRLTSLGLKVDDLNRHSGSFWSAVASIETLDLSENPLGGLPDLSHLVNLQHAAFVGCQIASLDDANLGVCASVQSLDFSQNPLRALPSSLATAFPNLAAFVARKCSLVEFPNVLTALPTLTRLDLSNNAGIKISVLAPSRLQMLSLASCGLDVLPSSLLRLSSLTDLDLSSNPLSRLPLTLATALPALATLRTADCPLRPFPAGSFLDGQSPQAALQELRKSEPLPRSTLMFLGFGGVGKSALADALFPAASSVELIGADGTGQHGQAQMVEGATLSVRTGRQNHSVPVLECRCVRDPHDPEHRSLVFSHGQQSWTLRFGDTALRDEWFDAVRRAQSNSSTEGVSLRHVPVDAAKLAKITIPVQLRGPDGSTRTVQVSLWDFAGQEELYHGHRLFLRKGIIYVVVWDASEKYRPRRWGSSAPVVGSTDGTRAGALADLQYWLESLQASVGQDAADVCVLIVANKTDCAPSGETAAQRDAQVRKLVRRVQFKLQFATLETSCKPGVHEGVESLRTELFKQLVAQSHIGSPVPATVVALRDVLRQVAGERRVLKQPLVASVKSLLVHVPDVEQLKAMLVQLHKWSECVFFEHAAPSVVVLEPQWLVQNVFSGLLAAAQLATPPGVVQASDLGRILQGVEAAAVTQVAQLLQEYSLLFPFRACGSADDPEGSAAAGKAFWLPAALGVSRPADVTALQHTVCLRVSFVVPGLLGAVLVEAQQPEHSLECVAGHSWRTGLVLRRGVDRAVVSLAEKRGQSQDFGVVEIGASSAEFGRSVQGVLEGALQRACPSVAVAQVELCAACSDYVPAGAGAEQCSKGHVLRPGGVPAALKPWIMISYNWAHQHIALKLKKLLEAAGYVVWMDVDKMAGNMDAAMAEAVDGAEAVIVCLTEGYKASKNCKAEFQYAVGKGKPVCGVDVIRRSSVCCFVFAADSSAR